MSYIPSHAMPHTFLGDDEELDDKGHKRSVPQTGSGMPLKLAGAALAGFLLYRILR